MASAPLDILPISGAMGAEIHGTDLSGPLDDSCVQRIRSALLEHGAVFFRDQKLTPDSQLAFASRFGEPEIHPIVDGTAERPEVIRVLKPAGESASFGVGWHTDNSFLEKPSLATLLYGETIPPYGGDTLYASVQKAYDALSETMKAMLDGLRAVHSASRAYDPGVTGEAKYRGEGPLRYRYSDVINREVEHPVIRTHPETGRRGIYVNPMFTQRIVGMTDVESQATLAFLYEHCARPDFTCRFRWTPGAVAMWDNRSVWHYAMDDYQPFERVMYRVTLAGDRPA